MIKNHPYLSIIAHIIQKVNIPCAKNVIIQPKILSKHHKTIKRQNYQNLRQNQQHYNLAKIFSQLSNLCYNKPKYVPVLGSVAAVKSRKQPQAVDEMPRSTSSNREQEITKRGKMTREAKW